jgi:hypothetical protein
VSWLARDHAADGICLPSGILTIEQLWSHDDAQGDHQCCTNSVTYEQTRHTHNEIRCGMLPWQAQLHPHKVRQTKWHPPHKLRQSYTVATGTPSNVTMRQAQCHAGHLLCRVNTCGSHLWITHSSTAPSTQIRLLAASAPSAELTPRREC